MMTQETIGAVVLAAGQSKRMGRPKMLLPWGEKTVIEQVVSTLLESSISPIVVVTGGFADEVAKALSPYPVRLARNPDFETTEMLQSLLIGLRTLPVEAEACLVVLGDQPQIKAEVVRLVVEQYRQTRSKLIVPSYQMRRGHPWLLAREYRAELAGLSRDESLRIFLNRHAADIHYLTVDTPTILADLDTPEDYQRDRPKVD